MEGEAIKLDCPCTASFLPRQGWDMNNAISAAVFCILISLFDYAYKSFRDNLPIPENPYS